MYLSELDTILLFDISSARLELIRDLRYPAGLLIHEQQPILLIFLPLLDVKRDLVCAKVERHRGLQLRLTLLVIVDEGVSRFLGCCGLLIYGEDAEPDELLGRLYCVLQTLLRILEAQ